MHSDQTRKDGSSESIIQALYYDFVANYVKTFRLERVANMIIILLTIINIHILTSLTYNSADLQACYLSNVIYIVQLDS